MFYGKRREMRVGDERSTHAGFAQHFEEHCCVSFRRRWNPDILTREPCLYLR